MFTLFYKTVNFFETIFCNIGLKSAVLKNAVVSKKRKGRIEIQPVIIQFL
jgi:hypothetical protein